MVRSKTEWWLGIKLAFRAFIAVPAGMWLAASSGSPVTGAQEHPPDLQVKQFVGRYLGRTPPLRNYLAAHPRLPEPIVGTTSPPRPGMESGEESAAARRHRSFPFTTTGWTDPVLQTAQGASSVNAPAANFEGIDNSNTPPDANISVGPDQIVEVVNSQFQVFNKSGNGLLPGGPALFSTITQAAVGGNLTSGDPCSAGYDPIALYDKIDRRWLIGYISQNNGYHFCLAISASGDATGSYFAYDIPFGSTFFDYVKLAIWADGSSWTSLGQFAGVYVSAVTTGATLMCGFPLSDVRSPPSSLTLVCAQAGSPLGFALPADLEGSPGLSGTTLPAPLGTPEYFLGFGTESPSNTLLVYSFSPNFSAGTASLSSFSLSGASAQQACANNGVCIPQSGTSQELEAEGGLAMYRLSYRYFGTSESMVVNESLQADSANTQTGVRWYQLSNPTPGTISGWAVAQQGTFAPSDGTYRWMGSAAQDRFGNLGLGYSTSGPSVDSGIAYTGRTLSDPSNTLEAEFQVLMSAAPQTGSFRWGDYSSLSVDPSDDCTFWYASEYTQPNPNTTMGTRIVAFRLGECVPAMPSATLTPTSLTFGNQQTGTASAPQAVTLANSGNASLAISSIAVTGINTGDFSQSNNCGSSLAAGASCAINVSFAPTATGTRTATLTVTDNASNSTATASLTGTGTSWSATIALVTKAYGAFSNSTNFASSVTSGPFAVPAGDLIVTVCGLRAYSPETPHVADTSGNVFTQAGATVDGSGRLMLAMYYAPNAKGSSSDVMTCTGSSSYHHLAVMVLVFSGADLSSPLDVTASGSTQGGTSIVTNQFSTTAPDEVLVAGMMSGSGCILPPTPGPGYTMEIDAIPSGCSGPVAATEDELAFTQQTNVTASMSFTSGIYADMVLGTFKAASAAAASVTLSPGSLTFGDQAVGTASTAQSVTLSNAASTALAISSIAISGANAGDFSESNNCGSSLPANSSCTLSVTFSPTATGGRAAALLVTDNVDNSPQSVSLSGNGTPLPGSAPAIVQVQNNLDLSTTTSYTSFSVPITTNPGDLLVAFARESSNGADNFTVTDSAGQAWTLTTGGYRNESSSGPRIAMFFVPNSAAVTSVTVNYATSGGVIKPGIMVMEISGAAASGVADGSVDDGTAALTTMSTSGALSTTNANDILIFATDAAANQSSWTAGAGFTIPNNKTAVGESGSNVRMAMQFAVVASSKIGTTTSMAYSNAAWNGNVFAGFKLASPASGSPAVTLNPTSLTFANQPAGSTSAPQTITLTNSGNAALSISSIAITGTSSNLFNATHNCPITPSTLAAGGSCNISLTFSPATGGTATAALTVADNAANSPQTVSLTGTGTAPGVTLNPTNLTFASQQVGTTSPPQTVALTNTGTAALAITSLGISGANPGDFGQASNCPLSPSTLAPSTNCTITLNFTPSAAGTRTATLTLTDNAGNSPQTVALTGNGTAIPLALAQVQNNIDTSGTAFTSFSVPITTKAGDLLVAFVREASNGTDNFTVTDSAGETWTPTASGYMNESNTGPRVGMFYMANSAAVSSVTVHYTTSGGVIKPGMMVMEISGGVSSGVADGSVNGGTAGSTTTSASGALTTTNANDILIFATDASGNEAGWTAGAGYAIPNNKTALGASGSNTRMAMQFAVVSAVRTGATTSMSYADSNWNGNIFAAFKGGP